MKTIVYLALVGATSAANTKNIKQASTSHVKKASQSSTTAQKVECLQAYFWAENDKFTCSFTDIKSQKQCASSSKYTATLKAACEKATTSAQNQTAYASTSPVKKAVKEACTNAPHYAAYYYKYYCQQQFPDSTKKYELCENAHYAADALYTECAKASTSAYEKKAAQASTSPVKKASQSITFAEKLACLQASSAAANEKLFCINTDDVGQKDICADASESATALKAACAKVSTSPVKKASQSFTMSDQVACSQVSGTQSYLKSLCANTYTYTKQALCTNSFNAAAALYTECAIASICAQKKAAYPSTSTEKVRTSTSAEKKAAQASTPAWEKAEKAAWASTFAYADPNAEPVPVSTIAVDYDEKKATGSGIGLVVVIVAAALFIGGGVKAAAGNFGGNDLYTPFVDTEEA